MFFSPVNSPNKCQKNKHINRPFSSFISRGRSFQVNSFNNNNNNQITDKKKSAYKINNNLYDIDNLQSSNATTTRNNYNKLKSCDFRGKHRYSNFTVFLKREMNLNDIKITPKNITKRLIRQKSAIELNPQKIFRDGKLYLTDIIKQPRKLPTRNVINYLPYTVKRINSAKNIFNKDNNNNNNKSNLESKIINNYKYNNINLLRKIDSEKNIKKISYDLEEEKNNYLSQKKMEYASINEKNSKAKYNYMDNINNYIENAYMNKLKTEKYSINQEEMKHQNQYINNKISSVKYSSELFNNLFLDKFHDYVKFIFKKLDLYDKGKYFLLNEVIILKKQIGKLKKRINILSDTKKIYNKFILLQIKLKKKTMNLPEYYEYILNHTLPEGIEYCDGIITKEEVKEIFGFKKNIIYKNYETFKSQFKTYENENRDLLEKLGSLKKEITKLNENKNELIKEGKQLKIYLNNKVIEKTIEKSSLLKRYNLLMTEKNKLLEEIKYNFTNFKNILKNKKNTFSLNVSKDFNSLYQEAFPSNHHNNKNTNNIISKIGNKTNSTNSTTRIRNTKNIYNTPSMKTRKHINFPIDKEKSELSIDEQIILNINVVYETKDKTALHSNLYFKVRKLYLLIKNYIIKEKTFKKAERVTSENGLIVKILAKIENGINTFLEKTKALNEKNKEIVDKMKQKIDKERKIIKGQKYRAMMKQKYENMKSRIEEKAKKIYFLPKTKKRNVSANINNKNKNKKAKKVVEKSEYDILVEYFKDN